MLVLTASELDPLFLAYKRTDVARARDYDQVPKGWSKSSKALETLDVDQLDRETQHGKTHADFIRYWLGAFPVGLARTPLRVCRTDLCLHFGASLVLEL
jgi:hypothetical protein